MALWGRDSRHPVERSADERYAAVREGRAVVQTVLAVTSAEAIDGAADRIVAARVLTAIARERKMSKLAGISDRIVQKKEAHDKKADEWAARLDELDRREPAAFAIGDAVIEEKEGDLAEMEKNMRTISNLPLADLKK